MLVFGSVVVMVAYLVDEMVALTVGISVALMDCKLEYNMVASLVFWLVDKKVSPSVEHWVRWMDDKLAAMWEDWKVDVMVVERVGLKVLLLTKSMVDLKDEMTA